MTDIASKFRDLTDVVADTVAREVGALRREAERERELREAEHRARMAELDAALVSVRELERRLADRLATLKDGEPGRDGAPGSDADPETIKAMVASAVAALPPAEPGPAGKSVTIDDVRPMILDAVAGLPAPKDGEPGKPGPAGRDADPDVVRQMVADAVALIPAPKDGEPGPRGLDGAPGKLPIVRAWTDDVNYEGAVVTHDGATWQALRDTGRAPPHEDWICIARAGRDGESGRSFTVRGTWSEGEAYRALDVVALNGAAFVARADDPGPCPGEGWQVIAMQGKQGKPGNPGPATKGEPGRAGPPVVAATIDDDGLLKLINGDGSEVTCDLYPLLSKLG